MMLRCEQNGGPLVWTWPELGGRGVKDGRGGLRKAISIPPTILTSGRPAAQRQQGQGGSVERQGPSPCPDRALWLGGARRGSCDPC